MDRTMMDIGRCSGDAWGVTMYGVCCEGVNMAGCC